MQENQPAAQIAARHNFFAQMAPYMSWIFLLLVGIIDPEVSRLGGEIVSHNTTDARRVLLKSWLDEVAFKLSLAGFYYHMWSNRQTRNKRFKRFIMQGF